MFSDINKIITMPPEIMVTECADRAQNVLVAGSINFIDSLSCQH
jgi:hypothetical protein